MFAVTYTVPNFTDPPLESKERGSYSTLTKIKEKKTINSFCPVHYTTFIYLFTILLKRVRCTVLFSLYSK